MLTEGQVHSVGDRLIEAETRTYYFGDLTVLYSQQRQIVTVISFFLSLGSVATLLAKTPSWIPLILSLIVVLANVYSLAFDLDLKMRMMAELNRSWAEVASAYEQIWRDPNTEAAEALYKQLREKERDLSTMASTGVPNHKKRMAKWHHRVLELRNRK